MKAKRRLILRGLLLMVLALLFSFAFAACNETVPEVKNVTITAAAGAELGKVDEAHVLGYEATKDSEVTVAVRKGEAEAQSPADYTYDAETKTLVFKAEGAYKVTVTAKINDKTGSAEAEITITRKAPVAPKITSLSVTSQRAVGGYVGASYDVAYEVSFTDAQVDLSVQKGEELALAGTDYALNQKVLTFLTAGVYKVVATPRGGEAVESDPITIVTPTINVSASATSVPRGETVTLTIETNPQGADVDVKLFLINLADDGSKAESEANKDTYEYDETTGEIAIKAFVNTKCKVKATIAGTNVSASTEEITVTAARGPVFDLTAEKKTVVENESVQITVSDVDYPSAGDTMESSSWKVLYKDGRVYKDAPADSYDWNETTKTFTPLQLGVYRIRYYVTCSENHTGTSFVDITVNPLPITLTTTMQDYTSIATATDLTYTIEGDASNYNISYTQKTIYGQGEIVRNSQLEKMPESKVNVTAAFGVVAEYTVTYTHKLRASMKYSVTFYVYGNAASVSLGEVTHNVLIPGVALKLYSGAESDAIVAYELLGASSQKAEIFDIANVGKIITLKDGATGAITLLVKATKNGQTTFSVQRFTIGDRGNGEGKTSMNGYYTAVTGKAIGDADYSWLDNNHSADKQHEKNSLLTKEGFVFNIDNIDDLNGGDMFQIPLGEDGTKTNLQFEFDFTILQRHGDTGNQNEKKNNVSLAIYFVPKGNWNGNSVIALYSDKTTNMNVYTNSGTRTDGTDPTFPTESNGLGYKIHVRITRIIVNAKVIYALEWAPVGTNNFTAWRTLTLDKENDGNSMGSPLDRIQFTHECGSYAIENFSSNKLYAIPKITATLEKETMRLDGDCSVTYSISSAVGGGVPSVEIYKDNVKSDKGTYNGSTKKLTFTEAGNYEVRFSATTAETVTKTITVTPLPVVTLTLENLGKTGVAKDIVVTLENSSETPTIAVQKKNGANFENAAASDYTYDATNKKITFNVMGEYKVIASIESGKFKDEKTIEISDCGAPQFTLTADATTVEEGNVVTLTASAVTYDTLAGDAKADSSAADIAYKVLYCATGSDYQEITSADADGYYTVASNAYTMKLAGNYKIEATAAEGTVSGPKNIWGKKTVTFTVTPATLTLSFDSSKLKNTWYRVVANSTDTDIEYNVTGFTQSYNVTYEGGTASSTTMANKGFVKVNYAEQNTYLVKVIYTNKAISTKKYELSIKVHAVADLANAPIFGADPIGTYGTLAPAFAIELFNNVKTSDDTTAFAGVVEWTIASKNVKKVNNNNADVGVEIKKTADDRLSYILVQDWDTHITKSATGEVVVKMTLKDSAEGSVVSVATKKFTVTPLGGNNGNSVNEYFQKVMTAYGNTNNALDITTMPVGNVEHGCITRFGLLVNRENQNAGWLGQAEFGRIYAEEKGKTGSTQKQWQIDYKLTVYGTANGDFCIKNYFNVGSGTNGAGNIDVKEAGGGNVDSWGWLTASGAGEGQNGGEDGFYSPQANTNPTIYVRIIRSVSGDTVTLKCMFSEDGQTYKRAYERFGKVVDPVTNAGDIGNPLNYIRLERAQQGSVAIENVTISELSA